MIGNLTDATAAFRDWETGFFDHLFSDEGSSRYVFRINGVIYKIHHNPGSWDNRREFDNANFLRPLLPANVVIPAMSLFDVEGNTVLAMEYAAGYSTGECTDQYIGHPCGSPDICLSDHTIAELVELGWSDPAYGNARIHNGIIYLVDVA